ncbi:Uncharacterised protein [uncultured archaeon]|nr:Uncharacterised protein [uncultured archaeon]
MASLFFNLRSNKSQTGTTLTWFVAFILIFFIMVIFLSATIISSGKKYVSTGSDVISLQEYSGNLNMQRNLFNILNSKIEFNGKEGKVKEVLRNINMYNLDSNLKSDLKTKIKKITDDLLRDSLDSDCYVFLATYGLDSEKITSNAGSSYATDLVQKNTFDFSSLSEGSSYSGYVEKQKQKLLESSTSLVIPRDTTINVFGVDTKENQMITIKFYSGKCL